MIVSIAQYDQLHQRFLCIALSVVLTFLKKKKKFVDSAFYGSTDTLFWTSGFQSQSGQPYSCLAELYVMYVPRDSPLV